MAKPTKKSTTSTKVTRIKASDTSSSKTKKTTKKVASIKDQKSLKSAANAAPKTKQKEAKRDSASTSRNPLIKFIQYVKGAWYELRQVRWPNRAETWKMTGALLAFTAFFVTVILLLDMLFKYLFELLIG